METALIRNNVVWNQLFPTLKCKTLTGQVVTVPPPSFWSPGLDFPGWVGVMVGWQVPPHFPPDAIISTSSGKKNALACSSSSVCRAFFGPAGVIAQLALVLVCPHPPHPPASASTPSLNPSSWRRPEWGGLSGEAVMKKP